jgi:hypothetical protein
MWHRVCLHRREVYAVGMPQKSSLASEKPKTASARSCASLSTQWQAEADLHFRNNSVSDHMLAHDQSLRDVVHVEIESRRACCFALDGTLGILRCGAREGCISDLKTAPLCAASA